MMIRSCLDTSGKQCKRKQSKPLNLSAICARILYTHVMSILAQLLGQRSAGLGPGPFSRDNPPCLLPLRPLPPSCASLWTQSEATRLHNSSRNLHFANTITRKHSLSLGICLRGKIIRTTVIIVSRGK